MKIAQFVGELLYDYECVVIPGLGGFIAEDKSVTLNKVTDRFNPPFRKIHFNIHLRANDGLLVNYVAQKENLAYRTAKQRVDNFVHLCHKALDDGKKINFKLIGSIYYDEDKNIVFKQNETLNYNSESFGLGSIVSPSIRRETDEEKVKKVVKSAIDSTIKKKQRVDRKATPEKTTGKRQMQATRRKSSFTNQVIFLAVVFFLMSIGYVYMRRDAMAYYFDRYYSHIPIFYSSVNDYLSQNINSTPVASLSRGTASLFPIVLDDNIENDNNKVVTNGIITNNETVNTDIEKNSNDKPESDIVIIEPSPENITKPAYSKAINEKDEPVIKIIEDNNTKMPAPAKTANSEYKYFIIAGSFSEETNAKKLVKELEGKGYNALIADTNKYGMFRVAIDAFKTKLEAERKLIAIRNETNPSAWVLEK